MVVGKLCQESSSHIFFSPVDSWFLVANGICLTDPEPQVIPLRELSNLVHNLWGGVRVFPSVVHTECRLLVMRFCSICVLLGPGVHLPPSRADVSLVTKVACSFVHGKSAGALLPEHRAFAHSAFFRFSFFLREFLDGWGSRVNEACRYAVFLKCLSYLAVNQFLSLLNVIKYTTLWSRKNTFRYYNESE